MRKAMPFSIRRGACHFPAAVFFALYLLTWHTACQSRVAVSDVARGAAPKSVLVLSFQNMAARYPAESAVRSPISGKVFPVGAVSDEAVSFLTDYVVATLEDRKQYLVITPGQARAVLSQMSLENEDLVPDRQAVVHIGSALSADTVLAGFVYRFKDRVGTAYGVDSPASVAFDLHLIQIPAGRIVWSAGVDDTQLSLSEDLFQVGKFIERKGRWVTAPDMARQALEAAFADFP
jgi:hypothetical protein